MKILVITHDKNLVGGANRSLLMVLSGLKNKYGVEAEVVLPGADGSLEPELKLLDIPCIIESYQCPYTICKNDIKGILKKINVHRKYYREIRLGYKMAQSMRDKGYDLVYTNTRYPVIGAEIAKQLKIAHICHVREFGSAGSYQGPWSNKKMYKMSQKVILISQALFNRMAQNSPTDKLVMIHNGIGGNLGIQQHELFPNRRFNMLLTGRITAAKGHKDALLALDYLLKSGITNAHLYIAGSLSTDNHDYLDELKKIVLDCCLSNNVTFLGEVKDMRMVREKMDVELMCAVCETFGRVTVEGMRSGLLVVGSNTGGTLEIINDGITGLLYKQGDPYSLGKVLQNAYMNIKHARSIAENGYIMAQSYFTEEKNVAEIYSVMQEVLKEKDIL